VTRVSAITEEQTAEQTKSDVAQVESRPRSVKLTVALPADAVTVVEDLATREGKTKTQVLREAIALKRFVEQELANEGTHFLVERDGVAREIVFT
jgi:hypothetical protein